VERRGEEGVENTGTGERDPTGAVEEGAGGMVTVGGAVSAVVEGEEEEEEEIMEAEGLKRGILD
jgi:hypothetical protein